VTGPDVVVVGSGPAGSATALQLARRRVSVTLVSAPLRRPAPHGEVLKAIAEHALRRLGVWEAFQGLGLPPSQGIVSAWGSECPAEWSSIWNPYGDGWNVDRPAFDSLLLRCAVAAGASLVEARALDAQPSAGRWSVTARTGSGSVELGPALVVDASGRSSWLGRRMGERRRVDRLIGVFRRYRCEGTPRPVLTVESAVDGWWYAVPAPERELVVVHMTDADLWSAGEWDKRLAETDLVRRLCEGLASVGGEVARSAYSVRTSLDRPGALAVGDACLAVDPLSSDGLCFSLISALEAAMVVPAMLDGDDRGRQLYEEGVDRIFARYLEDRRAVYGLEGRWPASHFWERRRRCPADPRA
jgi:flavin-dependent dehydrogenase